MSATAVIGTHHTAAPDAIMQIAFGFAASKTLFSAVELGLFTHLADGPATAPAIQQRLGLHPRAARDFLDTLVSMRLLERNGDVYSNAPSSAEFLVPAKETYIGGMLEMANRRLYASWGSLTEALRTGERQNETRNATDGFAALYRATPPVSASFWKP